MTAEIENLVSLFRNHADYELEACLGLQDSHTPQLPDDVALQLFMMLSKSAKAGHFIQRESMYVDYFYEDGSIRNRCFVSPPQATAQAIQKIRIAKKIGMCKERQFMFHFNLKQERVLDEFDSVHAGEPCHVRVQKEWVFTYKDMMNYVVKKVQSGKASKEECLQSKPHFEVELELLHSNEYLNSQTDFQVATSMIHKCLDLCGRFDQKGNREELSFTLLPCDTIACVEPTQRKEKGIQQPKRTYTKRAKKCSEVVTTDKTNT